MKMVSHRRQDQLTCDGRKWRTDRRTDLGDGIWGENGKEIKNRVKDERWRHQGKEKERGI